MEDGDEVDDGDIIEFECNSGFELDGSIDLMCEGGNFDGNFPTCSKFYKVRSFIIFIILHHLGGGSSGNGCKIPEKPSNGLLIPSSGELETGKTLLVICLRGYKATSPNTRVECMSDGRFNSEIPRCISGNNLSFNYD